MKRLALLAAVLAAGAASLGAQGALGAEEIVRASRDRIQADTVSSRSRMMIVAKDGSATERLVDQYSLDAKEGKRTVIVFQKPASVAGTRFLTVSNPGRDDDRWIFLPSLAKVRRIAGSEGSGSFVGTDFSYDDISSSDREVEEDTHAILREEKLEGKDCWVIESRPKDPSFQYTRMVHWIEKGSCIALKAELYDKKGLLKLLEFSQFKEVQGRITPMATKLSNLQANTSTSIAVEILKYDEKIPAGVFTPRYLETGRPQ
ncbi:MAG TPA: outer membrane lipoprotein-sorting protein [Spirochaetales bacterium]|nr:outer membrane lipoprotein-sorting protein [Spirochaetales bacterium]HRY54595.1 outer membrane lipoprotein-sorting protein [Spirochaetia bacterium]